MHKEIVDNIMYSGKNQVMKQLKSMNYIWSGFSRFVIALLTINFYFCNYFTYRLNQQPELFMAGNQFFAFNNEMRYTLREDVFACNECCGSLQLFKQKGF